MTGARGPPGRPVACGAPRRQEHVSIAADLLLKVCHWRPANREARDTEPETDCRRTRRPRQPAAGSSLSDLTAPQTPRESPGSPCSMQTSEWDSKEWKANPGLFYIGSVWIQSVLLEWQLSEPHWAPVTQWRLQSSVTLSCKEPSEAAVVWEEERTKQLVLHLLQQLNTTASFINTKETSKQ